MLEREGRSKWKESPSWGLTWNCTGRESFNFGKRKDSPPPGAGRQDERLAWHRPGVTMREQIADPGLRPVACFLGSKDEERAEVLDPVQSDWGCRRTKEGEIAAGLPPGWVAGGVGGC